MTARYCSFCGKSADTVKYLIAGSTASICEECVALSVKVLKQRGVDIDVHPDAPRSILLWCPECSMRHIDEGEFATKSHHTHACQGCGHVWRPAIFATVGVQFLPGFKNEVKP